MIKIILTLLSSAVLAKATITITGASVANLGDETGGALVTPTTFAMLVALNDDPFDGLIMSDTISVGQTVGNGKYFVLSVGSSADAGVFGQAAQGAVTDLVLTGPLASDAAAANHVALVWFPGLVGNVVTTGDNYGVIRATNWVLPSDGSALSFDSFVFPTTIKTAAFIVAIPEPSGVFLVGLGTMAFLGRRRRD